MRPYKTTALIIITFAAGFLSLHAEDRIPSEESKAGLIDEYHILEPELAQLISARRGLEETLSSERIAITNQSRALDGDAREALMTWRAERSSDFVLQESLRRRITETTAKMYHLLLEYNDIQDPGAEATDAERAVFDELRDQIRLMMIETVKHYERQAALTH